MAKCGSCGKGTSFVFEEGTAKGLGRKVGYVCCSSCNAVVGVIDPMQTEIHFRWVRDILAKLARQAGIILPPTD